MYEKQADNCLGIYHSIDKGTKIFFTLLTALAVLFSFGIKYVLPVTAKEKYNNLTKPLNPSEITVKNQETLSSVVNSLIEEYKKTKISENTAENEITMFKPELQLLGYADRYSNIWAEEVNNTGDKRLINRCNKFVGEFDYFKKNLHLSHEAWIAFYDGEIEWIALYPESDIISFKQKGYEEVRLNLFQHDIKIEKETEKYLVDESAFFYKLLEGDTWPKNAEEKTETLADVVREIREEVQSRSTGKY